MAETETWLVGAFSVSVLCLALTMPTGMVEVWPTTQSCCHLTLSDGGRNNNTCSGGDTLRRAGIRFIKAGGRDFTIVNIFQVPASREGELLDVLTLLLPPLLSPALDPGVIVREGPTALTIKVVHQNLLVRVLDDLYLVVFVIFNFRL